MPGLVQNILVANLIPNLFILNYIKLWGESKHSQF